MPFTITTPPQTREDLVLEVAEWMNRRVAMTRAKAQKSRQSLPYARSVDFVT